MSRGIIRIVQSNLSIIDFIVYNEINIELWSIICLNN